MDKTIPILLALIILLTGCTQQNQESATGFATLEGADSGLVAWYKFDDGAGTSANDSSGNANTGILAGGPTWTTGRIGGALLFDGNDDFVRANSDFIGTNDATVAAWIRPSGFGEGGSNGTIITNGRFIFRLRGPATALDYRASGNVPSGSAVGSIALNTWQFVILTRSGATANFYVNGTQSGTANQTNEAPAAGVTSIILGNNNSGSTTFQGEIDELRVYNRVLTQEEIIELYNYTGTGTNPPANAAPVANVSVNPLSGIAPLAVSFNASTSTDSDGTISSYQWNFGDGTNASGATTSHSYNIAGTYTATLTVTDNDGAMDTDISTITVSATQAQTYTLTAQKSGTGSGTITGNLINCGTACTQSNITSGTQIILTATSVSGSSFTGWSGGGCSGTQTTCSINITSNTTVTATFDASSTPSVECSATNIRCVPSEYTTIQACANAAVAGDTCLVAAGGTYNERVTVQSSGTSNSNRVTFLGQKWPRPKMHGFYLPTRSYVTIEGFEITSVGMSPISDRIISIQGGTGIKVLDNNIHDTSYGQCILSTATSTVFRDNIISFCAGAMSIFGTTTGPRTIDSSNNQIKFSVQGGPSQTITIPSGTYITQNSWFSLAPTLSALMSGAGVFVGASGRFEIRSLTNSPASTITLEPVDNNAYSAFGWTVGPGKMQGIHSAITIMGNDSIFENNTVSYVGDYVTTGGDISRIVIRNNIFGPAEPYSAQHIDGVQTNSTNGTQKLLFENNKSISNNNSDNHMALHQRPADSILILRYNSTYLSDGSFDFSRGGNTTLSGAFLYNNTLYNNANYIASGNVQVFSGTSLSNYSRNNIWYNSSRLSPYSYSGTVIEKDYDLWCCGTGNPVETHSVNREPEFVNGPAGNFNLQATSPARDAGGELTTTAIADSISTTLRVKNAGFFQDGWAGVNPDWIAVGNSTNVAQIQSINYDTNVITLASSLSWNLGDPVYLYRDSDGTQVLYGSAPDIGAFEYGSVGGSPALVNGQCGTTLNYCLAGTLNNIDDTTMQYLWNCNGISGGSTANCSLARANTPPTITISSPTNNSSYISPATITLSAQANDSDGTITRIEFYNGATLLATDATAPYTYTWNNIQEGNYTLTARAYDDQNANTTSTQTRITVIVATSLDTDNDGIDDAIDRCPNTISTIPRNLINRYGCPIPIATRFDVKPDFNSLDLTNVSDMEIGISTIGKISWSNTNIALTKLTSNQYDRPNLDTDINISNGKVMVSNTNLNKPATITFYNITQANPQIKKDGVTCTACAIISYDNQTKTLIFSVPGF